MLLPWLRFSLVFATALAKQTLNVFVINDFSLSFVRPSTFDRSLLPSGPFICPSSAYPNALSQFQFTSDVIADVQRDISMSIQYYVYSGGDGDPIGNEFSGRDNFTETSIPAYTKFCAEGPGDNDFERFIKLTITPSVKTDLLIIFTAASQSQINNVLPILSKNVQKVIVLGLNGTDPSNAYPESAVTLTDFAEPERVSCMVNELYETIHGEFTGGDVDAVAICYPQSEQTTTIMPAETESTATPPMRILIINDFTSDFLQDYQKTSRAKRSSIAIKCPGNAHPEASSEFDFTNEIVQQISVPMELYYYAYNGDNHAIAPPVDIDNFSTDTEFKDVVCFEDDPHPSDLDRLMITIQQYVVDVDLIVLLSAAPQSQFDSAFPLSYGNAKFVTVGLKGASAFDAYPSTATIIEDFSQPEVITCMIETAYSGQGNPVEVCGAKTRPPPMRILFINDFTTNFVGDSTMVKSPSNAIKCPGGGNPESSSEFDFTNEIVQSIDDNLRSEIFYYAYIGDSHPIDLTSSTKDDFAVGEAKYEFRNNVCDDDDRGPIDLSSLIQNIYMFEENMDVDIIVLLSAATKTQFDNAFPLVYGDAKVITVALKGTTAFNAYPNTSIVIDDFSQPAVIACMVNAAYNGEVNPAKICGAQQQRPLTILFINDFTADFVGDETTVRNVPTSKATYGKCPGGMYVQAGNEFKYTVDIVNRIRADADLAFMFTEYTGGAYFFLDSTLMTREDFAQQASTTFRDACFDDPLPSDFDALAISLNFVRADILVLFTATSLNKPLDIPATNFGRIIVVGLNGAIESKAYPDSSISITDFSRPEVVSCMIDKLWDDISSNSLLNCAN